MRAAASAAAGALSAPFVPGLSLQVRSARGSRATRAGRPTHPNTQRSGWVGAPLEPPLSSPAASQRAYFKIGSLANCLDQQDALILITKKNRATDYNERSMLQVFRAAFKVLFSVLGLFCQFVIALSKVCKPQKNPIIYFKKMVS